MKKNSSLSKNVNDKDSLKRDQIIQDYLKLNENANQSPEKYIDQDNMSISKNKKMWRCLWKRCMCIVDGKADTVSN